MPDNPFFMGFAALFALHIKPRDGMREEKIVRKKAPACAQKDRDKGAILPYSDEKTEAGTKQD